jgi:hypothetical protein
MAPVYHLWTIGWQADEIFIGSFSSLEKAKFHALERMCLHRNTWVELDETDDPVDEQNIVWKIEETSA